MTLVSALAEWDRQCALRPVFDKHGKWQRDRAGLPTREAACSLEDAIAAEADRQGVTATALRVRLMAARP